MSEVPYLTPEEAARERFAWAILWTSDNRLDGKRSFLLGAMDHPCRTVLFDTRDQARSYVAKQYGYIRDRADLQAEPHGWQMPKVVRVRVAVEALT